MKSNEKLAKIAIQKSLLKEFSNSQEDRIVYLNDGDEFQIQFFNPYSYVIGIEIQFNGRSANTNMLVLRPGERIWLDRFIDSESKFLFSVYEVETSKEVKKAIKENGNLKISFYKEKETNWWDNKIYDYTIKYPYNIETPKTIDVWYSSNSITTSSTNHHNVTCTSAQYNVSPVELFRSELCGCESKPSTIETGRIDKGSHSNQKFKAVDYDFELLPFKTEYIKLLPKSQKPITKNDLEKRYCHNCGRKVNPKFKYCPFCGTKQ